MTAYLGFDVLTTPPNAREETGDTFRRSVAAFDPGPGLRSTFPRDKAPAVDRSYLWTCGTRAEIVALKAWMDARRGQVVPFWIPSGRRDILLAQDIGAASATGLIQGIGYSRTAFQHASRRHLALILPSGLLLRQVIAAVDQGDTETLTLSAAPGVLVPTGALISYLLFCRMATDEPEIVYHTDSVAECSIPYVEIPEEAP